MTVLRRWLPKYPRNSGFHKASFVAPEVRPQLDHGLVMAAAHGLRINSERPRDLGDVHVAVVQHGQNLALAGRQQSFGAFEPLHRLDRVYRSLRLRLGLYRSGHGTSS